MIRPFNPLPFSTTEAAKVLGITPRRLQSHTERYGLRPEVQEASGRGTWMLWSLSDLEKIATVEMLSRFLKAEAIRGIIEDGALDNVHHQVMATVRLGLGVVLKVNMGPIKTAVLTAFYTPNP